MSHASRSLRPRSRTLVATAAAVAAMLLVAPLPAHAQLRGLMNKAREKAAEKVAEKAVDRAGAGSDRGTWATPTFGGNVVEITPGRVDALLRGLAAERRFVAEDERRRQAAGEAEDAAQAAYDRKLREYEVRKLEVETRIQRYGSCMMGASAGASPGARAMVTRMTAMSDAEREKLITRMQDLRKRGEAAQKRGDRVAVAAISDTAMKLMGMTSADVEAGRQANAAHKECGEMPPEMSDPSKLPVAPTPPSRGGPGMDDASRVGADRAGATAAGLPVPQYALLRERVGALVIRYARPGTKWGFTEGERNAVAARRAELNQYENLFDSGTINWGGIGDGE